MLVAPMVVESRLQLILDLNTLFYSRYIDRDLFSTDTGFFLFGVIAFLSYFPDLDSIKNFGALIKADLYRLHHKVLNELFQKVVIKTERKHYIALFYTTINSSL